MRVPDKTLKASSYHHGDLSRAAIETAIDLIADRGIDAVSMRSVASRIGVTHGALYQHFDSKKKLLSIVSERAYNMLAKKMRSAAKSAGQEPIQRLQGLAAAYVLFAMDEPALFRVMGEPTLTCDASDYPPLWEAHDRVVELLIKVVSAAQAEGSLSQRIETSELAMTIWTFTHGYAETCRTGRGFFHNLASPKKTKPALRSHLTATLDNLLIGLSHSS